MAHCLVLIFPFAKFVTIAAMKPSPAGRVVVVGSSNTDLVLSCARLPQPGETILGGAFERFAGGKGANQAVAAARAGAKVAFVGAHGGDDFGRAAAGGLKAEGINVRNFTAKAGHASGVALILIGGKERENCIAVARSANDELVGEDIRAAQSAFRGAGVVMAQLEIPLEAVTTAAEMAREAGALFLLNPAPARALPGKLLKQVDILTPNETEAEILTGEAEPPLAARALLKKGCRRIAMTLGAQGVLLVDELGERRLKAPKVKPVDTVGAGDCFSGYLAAGLSSGLAFDEAARRAVFAASLAVTRPGAQVGMPYAGEVDAALI